jgi:hypothetical protein
MVQFQKGPRSKHEKPTAGSAWETWTVASADGVRCACVSWGINFLLTFETAPFFCKRPVLYVNLTKREADIQPLHMQGNMLLFVRLKPEYTFQYVLYQPILRQPKF